MKKELSQQQQDDAARLRLLFDAWKEAHGGSQAKAAAAGGFGSQGTVWQYLNGRIALNASAVLKFAKLLQCSPWEISPSIAAQYDLTKELGGVNREDAPNDWPFFSIPRSRFDALTDRQKGLIEGRLAAMLDEIEKDPGINAKK